MVVKAGRPGPRRRASVSSGLSSWFVFMRVERGREREVLLSLLLRAQWGYYGPSEFCPLCVLSRATVLLFSILNPQGCTVRVMVADGWMDCNTLYILTRQVTFLAHTILGLVGFNQFYSLQLLSKT